MIKYDLTTENLNNCLNLALVSGCDFELTISNYTAKIESTESELLNFSFIKEEKKPYFFSMYRELKIEVEKYLENNLIELGKELRYYDIVLKKDFVKKEIINIDLSSAYINILKNKKIITNELFLKLEKLPKLDRLGVVGMLASKKNKYFYRNGEIQEIEIIENKKLSDVFFYCVYKTFLIMQDLKMILKNNYIFSWVDGIYFLPEIKNINLFEQDSNVLKIKEYLIKNNLPFKVELLNNFMYNKFNGNIEISYLKENKEKNFSIPLEKGTFLDDMYELLNAKNNEKR